jgi:two-component system response regulator FlrC
MAGKKILLVDQDLEQRALVAWALDQEGYFLVTAPDVFSALEKLAGDAYDLVISEMNFPQLDGLNLLKRMKDLRLATPVVVVTSRASVAQAVEAMKLGVLDFILKPFHPEALKALLSQTGQHQKLPEKDPAENKYALITHNRRMKELLEQAKDIADSHASVFIQGESGTGKELFARYIHRHSKRKDKPFVAVNCSALPETLLESEILGHEKGSFTGAVARKKGKFELANEGTLLLDEISEMAFALQSKLLRVLQEREVDRIGGEKPIPVDVRVMATTNREIEKLLKEGSFREDLFFRLNVIPFRLPPLRERKEDIPVLARFFVEKVSRLERRSVKGLTDEAAECLARMSWRGNVRELENTVARAVLLCKGERIEKKDLFPERHETEGELPNSMPAFTTISLKELEKKTIFYALDRTNGNRTHAAEILGISVRTLRNKLNEYREKMQCA